MAPGSVNLVLILEGNCYNSCRTVGQDLESVDQKVVLTECYSCIFFNKGYLDDSTSHLLINNTVHREIIVLLPFCFNLHN